MVLGVRGAMLFLVLLVAVVVLYLNTRNEWDWSRLARRAFAVAALVIAAVAGWVYWSALPPNTPLDEWWGVPLGASEADVRYLKGEPTAVVQDATWAYVVDRSRTYYVSFGEAGHVDRVLVVPGRGYSSGLSLFGIRDGFDADRLIDQLGEPSGVITLTGGLRRAYLYRHLNAVFILEKQVIVSYGMYDAGAGDPFAEGDDPLGVSPPL